MSKNWLDHFPPHWKRVRLKNLVADVMNGTWGEEPDPDEEGVLCIRAADFDRLRHRVSREKLVRRRINVRELAEHRLEIGDLVLEKSGGGDQQPVGVAVLYDLPENAVATNFAARVRPAAGVDPRFLNYVLASTYFMGLNHRSIKQTTGIQNLDTQSFFAESWAVPGAEEQVAIANFLDLETARIDQISKMKQSLIDRIQERRTTLVANALPGLGDVRFGGDGIPFVMTKWPLVRLGHVASVQTGMTLDAGRATADEEVELPYLRVANVQDGWVDLEEVKDVVVPRPIADSSRLAPGDVLMTEGGDPDKLGRGTVWKGQIGECLHQNHIFAVRPSPDRLLSSYLALLTRTPLARTYFEVTASKTTGIASTSSGKIRSWRIPLPPVEEQEQAVKRVSERERILVEAIEGLQKQLAVLAERRQSLITAIVTGQLDVGRYVGAAS